VHLAVSATVVTAQSSNVIADSTSGRADRTVVVGAHLDSVTEGPGINDNGSGSATILEVAKQMARLRVAPVNRVRFAWWGGEEFGLLGSEHPRRRPPAPTTRERHCASSSPPRTAGGHACRSRLSNARTCAAARR
jgi:Zn-dependent M28 family amino/carboxypeptidase